jgi:nicotinamidase-related amidase
MGGVRAIDADILSGSGFENTGMNYQLRQRDITNLVLAGFESHTCFESTARGSSEL